MKLLSIKIQTILAEINNLKRTQEDSLQSVEGSYGKKLQEIRDLRKNLNAALDALEKTTLKELDEIRTKLQVSLKKDVDNCSRLKDELQQLSEAVQGLCDKSKKEMEFIASRKCLDKIHESETYLRENPVKVQSSLIFQANTDIELYLSQQSSLGRIVDSMQYLTLKMILDKVMNVKRKSEYNVKIPSDPSQTCDIEGICSLPSGQVIVADYNNKKVKLLDKSYNVSGYCDVSGCPYDICQITSSEVAVTTSPYGAGVVHFISVSNGQLVTGRKLQLQHDAVGIAHHLGALYITSFTALYHYNMTGTLVKKLYEDTGGANAVFKCAVSPDGERIFVINHTNHKLLTLAKDGAVLSAFTDSDLQNPRGLNVTPAGQVLVCAYRSNTVIQVDHEGRKKLATLVSNTDGVRRPSSICYNTNTDQIIVGEMNNNKIIVMDLQ
ncbi:uncharacterized protein LOC127874856 isoform X2 [Dreissena polymorpha]|nr:uncharacterized protein LOC127874856 isoform X2 [Dreissena polymorpha]